MSNITTNAQENCQKIAKFIYKNCTFMKTIATTTPTYVQRQTKHVLASQWKTIEQFIAYLDGNWCCSTPDEVSWWSLGNMELLNLDRVCKDVRSAS